MILYEVFTINCGRAAMAAGRLQVLEGFPFFSAT